MSKLKCRIRGRVFTVPDGSTKESVSQMFNDTARGIIVVCPDCRKVDIDIFSHFDECDPAGQASRDYDWAESVGDR